MKEIHKLFLSRQHPCVTLLVINFFFYPGMPSSAQKHSSRAVPTTRISVYHTIFQYNFCSMYNVYWVVPKFQTLQKYEQIRILGGYGARVSIRIQWLQTGRTHASYYLRVRLLSMLIFTKTIRATQCIWTTIWLLNTAEWLGCWFTSSLMFHQCHGNGLSQESHGLYRPSLLTYILCTCMWQPETV